MITRQEAAVASWLGGGWAVNMWAEYVEPGLQAILLLATVIGAVIVVYNRILDNKRLRMQIQQLEDDR